MSLEYALGRDLSDNDSTTLLPGAITNVGEQKGDYHSKTVIIRGPLAALENLVPEQGTGHSTCRWVPDGYFVKTATLSSSDGEATITLSCIAPGTGDNASTTPAPTLIQYQILMSEVQMDLITHPNVAGDAAALNECLKWLASDEAQRFDGTDYYWIDEDGNKQPVSQSAAQKFCYAWSRGIRTYNNYYPVIEKQSFYTRVPGLTLGTGTSSLSVTGGTAIFSRAGKFDEPDIQISGYNNSGFFKSGDEYRSSGKGFMRSEQWTWTPDYADNNLKWIYDDTPAPNPGGNTGGVTGGQP